MSRILITTIIFVCSTIFSQAKGTNLFTYDINKVNQELAQLQALEDYINANPGITLSNLQEGRYDKLTDLNLKGSFPYNFDDENAEPPLGIPSFLWGCVFSYWGILIVYLVTENKEETIKSLKGCIVGRLISYGIFGVVYLIIYAIYGTTYFYY